MKQASGVAIPIHFDDLCDPACTALLIYDMQVGIRQQLKGADTIVAACVRALTAARSSGMRVVFTRHLSCPRAWMGATQYRTAMNWQRVEDPAAVTPWFLRGSPASDIIPELQPSDDELVLDKLAMSAFEGTPLAFALRDSNITGIAIVGIALEIGIEPTVRHATDLGFIPMVLTDACGAGHADAGQRALDTMRFVGEAILGDVGTFSDRLQFREAAAHRATKERSMT
jgi:nicotinamidase-related amidase